MSKQLTKGSSCILSAAMNVANGTVGDVSFHNICMGVAEKYLVDALLYLYEVQHGGKYDIGSPMYVAIVFCEDLIGLEIVACRRAAEIEAVLAATRRVVAHKMPCEAYYSAMAKVAESVLLAAADRLADLDRSGSVALGSGAFLNLVIGRNHLATAIDAKHSAERAAAYAESLRTDPTVVAHPVDEAAA